MADRTAERRTQQRKARRIYERHFKDVRTYSSDTSGGFSQLPWVLRRVQWLFTPRAWQVLTYLMMRAGPDAVVWQTDKEIAFDLGIGPRKLAPHIKSLVERGFIRVVDAEGQRLICIPDPLDVIRSLVASGEIRDEQLDSLNDDLVVIGMGPIGGKAEPPSSPLPVADTRRRTMRKENSANVPT